MMAAAAPIIRVENLTRRYGRLTAVAGLTFEVARGEIVGFLGPNGAGKTTTMRILAGYLPPTSGHAMVAGYDVVTDSLRARERVGYMPEAVPLPPDMRVADYLTFRAQLKGVLRRRVAERVGDAIHLCGLEGFERKFIGTLSKGYRQRVGLADALVHEPDLLILDEPTIGLDPNQIRQARALIRNLARHHTVLLSSHILPEVEMTCSRVIIIHAGKIQAVGGPGELREQLGRFGCVRLEVKVADAPAAREKLRGIEGVEAVESSCAGGWVAFRIEARRDVRVELAELARREGWPLRELACQAVTLEEVFAEATSGEEGL